MAFGEALGQLPMWLFDTIHIAAALIVIYCAVMVAKIDKLKPLVWFFVLYVTAELSYLIYHLGAWAFIFSHTLSEVLVLVGVVAAYTMVKKL